MKTILQAKGALPLVLAATLIFAGCAGDKSRGADSKLWRERDMLEISVLDLTLQRIRIQWKFTNMLEQPIWFPVAWGGNLTHPPPLPLAFVVPPQDLLLLFGDAHYYEGQSCTHEITPGVKTERIDPGKTKSGIVVLDKPYTVQRLVESPYEYNQFGGWEKEVNYDKVLAIEMAVEYWLCDPRRAGCQPQTEVEDMAYTRTNALVVINGSKPQINLGGIDSEANRQIVVSKRLNVDLEMADPMRLFYIEQVRD